MSKIPENAKQVFKGVVFDVWQWPQKMYDGLVETFEQIKRPDTAVVVPVVGNQIMILDQEQPHLPPHISCPSGRIEEGETPLGAAKREFLEETGYVSNDWAKWYSEQPVDKIDWTVHLFIARNCRYQQPQQLENGEKIITRFMTFDDFLCLADNPRFRGGNTIVKLLRAKYEPAEREKLRRLLFKNNKNFSRY